MDSIKSFKGYGKVDEAEERAYRRRTRKRFAVIIVSVALLLVIVVGAVAGAVVHRRSSSSSGSPASSLSSVEAICNVTLYKDSCTTSLAALSSSKASDPNQLFQQTVKVASAALSAVAAATDSLATGTNDQRVKAALADCKSLVDDAAEQLNDVVALSRPSSRLDDVRTWLSSALTNQDTCIDGLGEISVEFAHSMQALLKNSTEFTSNSLAIATKVLSVLEKLGGPVHRRLLGVEEGFPGWVRKGERRLLAEAAPSTSDVVVAQDGSGNFRSIKEAVDSLPKKSKKRIVIHVKAGEYKEKVELDKSKWNVMMFGDGMGKTIVTGGLNFADGTPTFATATFVTAGRGFIARDMTFRNTAGPDGHQAVALRSGSDQSVFFRCSFEGHQDTLYPHSNRQYYKDCRITGTIDFIFGNAAVVFQGCEILPRQPNPNQKNTITAQGKKDPNQNTGISIQQCKIAELDSNLTAPTYLGRPWKEFSTTVIMQTAIGGFINPAGWLSWTGDDTEPPSTIFYAEYMNSGLGSGLAGRVKWAGFKAAISKQVARQYTVSPFIQGGEWLPNTGVEYGASL